MSENNGEATGRALAAEMLENAREARLNFCVFPNALDVPGETSALARLVWINIPEIAKQMGVPIGDDEGKPKNFNGEIEPRHLMNMASENMMASRSFADWLIAAKHLPDNVAGMFAKGKDNTLNPLLDAYAAEKGVRRTDSLAVENKGPVVASFARSQAASNGY